MDKIDVVLVVLNGENLESAVDNLNKEKVKLAAIFMDGGKDKTFGAEKIPIISFAKINAQIKKYKDLKWLIGGGSSGDAFQNMKRFLTVGGVPEDNIFSTEVASQISTTWLANLKHIKEHGADFFATGNEYTRDGLNLKYIPRVNLSDNDNEGGVILADEHQDLRQSYLTAKYVFEQTEPGTIKFVLIGLTPDAFYYDNSKDFANAAKNLQYQLALNPDEENLLKDLTNADVKNIFETTTSEQADLNFEATKKIVNGDFSIKAVSDLDEAKFSFSKPIEENIQILKDYIELCLANDAKPIGVVFPFAPVVRENHSARLLRSFRRTIRQIEESSSFKCVDMFDLNINYDCFSDTTHLNTRGAMHANAFLSLRLYEEGFIPIESFCDMTYEYFHFLSKVAPKDNYNAFMDKVFKASTKMIQRKDKIKLGFVLYLSAEWCGDDLYHLFANDERFETSIFLCKRMGRSVGDELFQKDFLRGIEQFKSHNLNVVPIEDINAKVPNQDVLFFLIPYFANLPRVFRPASLTLKTLIAHITYSFMMSASRNGFYNRNIFRTAWKIFFSSSIVRDMFAAKNAVGMPRGIYSGYPRIDIFFDEKVAHQFQWKTTHPNAKKIIWAPHWSIADVTKQSTFQWNYKFMYEFAKAHPEISWVVKPHPGLFFSAVKEKVFPTLEAFKEYLHKWDELPNAQVYTGAYYQDIFATSDGMIHDSSSFIAEYQYVNKPMIFLTREKTTFNKLGKEILKASYLVDGKDFDAIAAMIQRVFIEGDDYKAAERKEVFDNYLNYPKYNGMLASEFIYHSIADELKEESK